MLNRMMSWPRRGNAEGKSAVWHRALQGEAGTSRLKQVAVLVIVSVAILGVALVVDATRLASPTRLGDLRRAVVGYPELLRRSRARVDLERFARLAASQVGYGPAMRKRFTSARPFGSFSVVDERDGSTAFAGGQPIRELSTDVLGDIRTVWIGDFSALRTPGRYHIVADNGRSSYPFDIGTGVFDASVRAVQRALYFQRAFTSIDAVHAEGPWTHPSDAARAPEGVRQGWHDAGDFSIYNAQATAALFWLLEAYNDFRPADDDTNIPESGNGVPDLLDEARWELEWMLSVQDATGGFRNTTCQERYGPYGMNPLDDGRHLPESMRYKPGEVGTMATARAVGTLAYAAAIFAPIDREFASRSLEAAWRGWRYLEARPNEHSDGPTCPASRQDGDPELGREVRLYAAAGMLLATGDPKFRQAFDAGDRAISRDASTFHTHVYALRVYLRAPAGDPARRADIGRRLRGQADVMRNDAARHPFEWSGHYFWGSINAGFERGGGFGAKSCLSDPTGASADCDAIADNVHYALGRNIFQLSYVSGLPGVTKPRTRAFHHWLATLNATPFLFPGLVAGGPNDRPESLDISIPGSRPVPVWGYWGDPGMPRDEATPLDARFTDNDSFSTNEIDVVWQAAALYNLYFAQWLAGR
jgi:endoglucanase